MTAQEANVCRCRSADLLPACIHIFCPFCELRYTFKLDLSEIFSVPGMRMTQTPKRGTERHTHVHDIGQHRKFTPSHSESSCTLNNSLTITLKRHHWLCQYVYGLITATYFVQFYAWHAYDKWLNAAGVATFTL